MGTHEKIGGARRDRTVDLLHAMQALSQLSYGPTRARQITVTTEVCQVSESDCVPSLVFSRSAAFHLIAGSRVSPVCQSRHVEISTFARCTANRAKANPS